MLSVEPVSIEKEIEIVETMVEELSTQGKDNNQSFMLDYL